MSDEHLSLPKETQSSHERTTDYVNMHQARSDSVKSKDVKIGKGEYANRPKPPDMSPDELPSAPKDYGSLRPPDQRDYSPERQGQQLHSVNYQQHLSHVSPGFTPPSAGRFRYYPPDPNSSRDSNELAKYLMRSQLLTSELTKFDDKPENYLSWKSSFINAIDTLELRASEQIDLLVKSLGAESTKHAHRIKAVNITNPAVALELIWERLEEIYGSPEAIESALFTKLDQFPKIGPRDNQKLRELSDLLQEINAAKQEGYLHGLSYLDTARGVAPIVDKLPYGIQDKWMMEGSHYKQRHRVTFPPFTFFLQFIQTQAKARNDPSFNLLSTCNSGVKRDKLGDG